MNPRDKLREDIRYWKQQIATAQETQRIAEAVLPNLEAQLRAADLDKLSHTDWSRLVSHTDTAESEEEEPRFSGQCSDQVLQALLWKPRQSSDGLAEVLKLYGRAFGRGAIGYALRKLKAEGKIVESGRQGNFVFYSRSE